MTDAEPGPSAVDRVRVLERRLARERAARAEAESITERVTSELYETVQELTRSTKLAQLLSSVASRANEAHTLHEAVDATLAGICAYTGWPVGHALVRSADGSRMISTATWYLEDAATYEDFRAVTESLSFAPGVGVPGSILASSEPLWAPDLARQENFPRVRAALANGLLAGFGIPVLIRNETVAVLEFFTTTVRPPDEALLQQVGFVGAQLGRVVEREQADARLTRLALYDSLTGLPNRTMFMDCLRASIEQAQARSTQVDVLYLDIDDFKTINDSQGHQVGDDVLAAVAVRLQDSVRNSGPTTTIARLGGDEFAVILDGGQDPRTVADSLALLLQEPLGLRDEVFVTVSVGAARAEQAMTAQDVLTAANVAMHEAKRAGKSNYIPFEPSMQADVRRRHDLGEQLRRALEHDEFVLAYQPVVDLADGRITGAEALVRWQLPDGTVVPPIEFISRAEETGLIVPRGAWVLETACRQAAAWRAQHGCEFAMAVNISGRQLREPGFPDLVRSTLRDTGLEPDGLCLEMTESILMEHDVTGIAMLTQLRADGVHLAIDDFGTGYSSLAALRQLPFDLVKIDRTFVSSLPEDDDAGTIAWAIVRLGHTLGMPVLAEGVETVEQRDALRRFGCDSAQGYLFSRPVPAERLGALLAEQAQAPVMGAASRPERRATPRQLAPRAG